MELRLPTTTLADARVRIRPWRLDDLDCVAAASADPEIPRGTTVPAAYTHEAGTAFIERQQGRIVEGVGISQAITDPATDEAIGLIILSRRPQHWIAGLGYWLIPAARRQGHGSAAIRIVADWALADLDVVRVEAWVAPENVASQRTLARAGFSLEGRLNFLELQGQIGDGLVFALTRPSDRSPDRSPDR